MRLIVLLVVAAPLVAGCANPGEPARELVVFHAVSLSIPLKEAAAEYEALHPGVSVELEPGGSLHNARKIADLNRACDVFASADLDAITKLLMPDHASWYLVFASNELVLAYRAGIDASLIPSADNWTDLLLDASLKFGRSEPNAEPVGYRTVLLLKLADPNLANAILEKDQRFVRPNPAGLIALLETGAIDYAFVYRSMAIQHDIPFMEFPPELNLGDPAHAAHYANASVDIAGERPGETMTIQGSPIVYALTIPHNAPNPALAEDFLQFFLSETGGLAIVKRHHQKPLVPTSTPHHDAIPDGLKPFARPGGP